MILSGKMTPVSKLSSAFLAPPSPLHLQFAYFESSLVVEYLVEEYGLDALSGNSDRPGRRDGDQRSAAASHRAAWSAGRGVCRICPPAADGLAPDATWEEPELPPRADAAAIGEWIDEHPKSVPGWSDGRGSYLASVSIWRRSKRPINCERCSPRIGRGR